MNFIVITSIFPPTKAVKKFSKHQDYSLVVVGDRKTPIDWQCFPSHFLDIDSQEGMAFKLAKLLPFNHYSRKMIGYLWAIEHGAQLIIDTDDDNIPQENWGFPALEGNFDCIEEKKGFINIYQLFTNQKIWPRGLPLNLISKKEGLETVLNQELVKVGIWQGLADGDPDVDAIYRLTNNDPCFFNQRSPVALKPGTISPFNSQNTLIRKELFALLYLPSHVTFRFTDILRGLVAQPIMWCHGYLLGFSNATVLQERNPHDFMKDFTSEIPMYKYSEQIIPIVERVVSPKNSIEENLLNAYKALLQHDIVIDAEIEVLEAWLSDLSAISTPL
jgi:STELLO glycosyltransferases